MTAKQTPLVDILRLHAEDLHNDYGHNKSARLLSQAADEIERLRATLEKLLKYAWHKPGCEKCCVPIGYHSCTCGYDALMRKWRKNHVPEPMASS